MEEQLLREVGVVVEKWVKNQIQNKKFTRFDKSGKIIKPSPRKIYGTGQLLNSVEVRIDNGDILILMEDYGADILFGEGRRADPTFKYKRKNKNTESKFISNIRTWMRTVPSFQGLEQKKLNSISFAIVRNITKRGIEALDLFREEQFEDEVFDTLEDKIDEIIQRGEFNQLGLNVDDLINKIILLSSQSMEIIEE